MRGILIDPNERNITEVDVPHEGRESDWRFIREQIGVEYLQTVRYSMQERLHVDEEGLYDMHSGRFQITLPAYNNQRAMLTGKALVLGISDDGFDTGSGLDLEALRANVSFLPARGVVAHAVAPEV